MKSSTKKSSLFVLIAFAIITVVLWQFPFGYMALYPFTILGTWFHEMGHGITAMLLGGNFNNIEIFPNGSGLARHSGELFLGNIGSAIVAGGGPMGPTIVGATFIALSRKNNITKFLLWLLGAVLIISVVLWVRSLFGIMIITAFGVIVLWIAFKAKDDFQAITLQFLGVQACMSVYMSIGYLFSTGASIEGSQYSSDTEVMAQYLLLPYWVWGGLIIGMSILLIYKAFKYAYS